jgi:hypothetical protein
MLLYLSGLPLWELALVLVVVPTTLGLCVLILVRRRFGIERLTNNNEIAGFEFAAVSVIYAVLLAFAVIVVWEKFSDAETAVIQEAGAAATVYRLVDGSDPESVATRAATGNYLRLAVDRDWPMMARGKRSADVTNALNELYSIAVRMTEHQTKDRAIYYEIFKQLDVITQTQRIRLHLATGVVPSVIWLVLYSGAALTVAFTLFFGAEDLWAQIMMTTIVSLSVFLGLVVIVSIDHPFTGPVRVGYEPLRAVIDDFERGSHPATEP